MNEKVRGEVLPDQLARKACYWPAIALALHAHDESRLPDCQAAKTCLYALWRGAHELRVCDGGSIQSACILPLSQVYAGAGWAG